MNLIIWLVVGGVIGWLASLVMKTDAQQGMILNVVVGIVGALLGGWLLSPLRGGNRQPGRLQHPRIAGLVRRRDHPAVRREPAAPRRGAVAGLANRSFG